jgi:hypothetical protein
MVILRSYVGLPGNDEQFAIEHGTVEIVDLPWFTH